MVPLVSPDTVKLPGVGTFSVTGAPPPWGAAVIVYPDTGGTAVTPVKVPARLPFPGVSAPDSTGAAGTAPSVHASVVAVTPLTVTSARQWRRVSPAADTHARPNS
jgi:hypothetical protein